MSNGDLSAGLEATPAMEMRAFDSLAPELRELLNYSALSWSAVDLATKPTGGSSNMGGVAIWQPDRRGDHAKAIMRQEALIMRGLPRLERRPRQRGHM